MTTSPITSLSALSWAYSTCPNDTFIFGTLALGQIPEYTIQPPYLGDIQQLNALALAGKPDVVKISAALYPQVAEQYELLPVGSAFGIGIGPILVKRQGTSLPSSLARTTIAVPGFTTTAHLLLKHFHPEVTHCSEVLFSEIPSRLTTGEFPAGVLIHEGRFTYEAAGLALVEDLGKRWFDAYQLPLPLGVIVIRRTLPETLKAEVTSVLRASLALAHRAPTPALWSYIATQAQIADPEVIAEHIATYVNAYTENLGEEGRLALERLTASAPLSC